MKQSEITAFPNEVINELKYYVYRLIDPRNGETFYVGKGKGNRVFEHMKCALAGDDSDELTDKFQRIREITHAGLETIHVIHRHGIENEDTALEVEAALIDAYPGLTNIASGIGSFDNGPMHAKEIIKKYAAEEVAFFHKVVMITVNRTAAERGSYSAVRFAWKLDKNRAARADYVAAVLQGIIIGIFVAREWLDASIANFPEFGVDRLGRTGFYGEEAPPEIKELYIGKRIPYSYRKKGASNPVKYSY